MRVQPGQDVIEVRHAERDHRPACPRGPHGPVIDDHICVLADLPQKPARPGRETGRLPNPLV
jgi:hypothetical protein